MHVTEFEKSDVREAAIAKLLGAEGIVLWRHDAAWSAASGIVERHAVGLAAGEGGPDLFMASAWITTGQVNARVNMRLPLASALARRLPETGEHGARRLRIHPHGDYDNAVSGLFAGNARYLGRTANTSFAAYVLRLGEGRLEEVAVATAWRQDGGHAARCELRVAPDDLLALAEAEFGISSAPAAPR